MGYFLVEHPGKRGGIGYSKMTAALKSTVLLLHCRLLYLASLNTNEKWKQNLLGVKVDNVNKGHIEKCPC